MQTKIKRHEELLSIGQVAERTGLSVSAIRYYESEGLVKASRNAGRQRRFQRGELRRLSFIMIAQQMGFSLENIQQKLKSLPDARTPTQRDWTRISAEFRAELDDRIARLTRMRERLDGCIGCGCLLVNCALYNPDDNASARGSGPRYLIGDP